MTSEEIRTEGDEQKSSIDEVRNSFGFDVFCAIVALVIIVGCLLGDFALAGSCGMPTEIGPNYSCISPGPTPHPSAWVYAFAAFIAAMALIAFGFASFRVLAWRARARARKETLRILQLLNADQMQMLKSGLVSAPQLLAGVQQRIMEATRQFEELTVQIDKAQQREQVARAIAELNEQQADAVSAIWLASLDKLEQRSARRELYFFISGAVLSVLLAWLAPWLWHTLSA